MEQQEAIAGIRIIAAVARADGKLEDAEKLAFEQAVSELAPELPGGLTADKLLTEEIDLDATLAEVKSPVMRKAVFESAFAMSLVDGSASDEENAVVAKIRSAFALEKTASLLGRTLKYRQDASQATPVLSPEERAVRIKNLIGTRAFIAACFGAIPIPLVSDVGVLLQIDAVVEGVSVTWGHALTRKERLARFGAVISIAVAQGAVHSLLKLIPGWGSAAGAIGGAVAGFAAVTAVGRVVSYHFEHEGKTTPDELRKVFTKEKAEAKNDYAEKKDAVDRTASAHADQIAALTKQLEKNEITVEEFDQKVSALIASDKT